MGTLRENILSADDLPTEDIDTPEWEHFGAPTVRVRGLSATDREKWENSLLVMGPNGKRVTNMRARNVRAGLVARVVVEPETGELMFTEKDIDSLGKRNAAVIERLFEAGRRLSGMQTEDEDEEANPSMGELEDGSSSDLPSLSEYQTQTGSPNE